MALLASLIYTPVLVIWIAAKYIIQNAPAVFSFPLQWWRHRLPNKWLVATWYLVLGMPFLLRSMDPFDSVVLTEPRWATAALLPDCISFPSAQTPTAYLLSILQPTNLPVHWAATKFQCQWFLSYFVASAQWVGFFNIGLGIGKIPISGSDSGCVGVLKSTIGYFRVPFYSWVFLRIYDLFFWG